MEQRNILLKEQLEHSRTLQGSLESELIYIQKEKALLTGEIRELSMQLAGLRKGGYQVREAESGTGTMTISTWPDPNRVYCHSSESNISMGFTIEEDGSSSVKKREDDFNSILDFVRKRGSDITYYQAQLDQNLLIIFVELRSEAI